jgi:hypothetical protein
MSLAWAAGSRRRASRAWNALRQRKVKRAFKKRPDFLERQKQGFEDRQADRVQELLDERDDAAKGQQPAEEQPPIPGGGQVSDGRR